MATGRAVVVGGGIGGLAAGVALARSGWLVTVCERHQQEPAGSGLSLWPNALHALDLLGAGDAVRRRAQPVREGSVRRADGRLIARARFLAAVEARFGEPLVVLPRAELTGLLTGLLPDGALRCGVRASVTVTGGPSEPALVRVVPQDAGGLACAGVQPVADVLHADLVVAADGIGSATRGAMFPGHPGLRYAGYTTWRFVTAAPGARGEQTWGPGGQRFAVVPMAGGRVYCFATAGTPPDDRAADEADELRRRFGAWHEPVPGLLAGLSGEQVLRHDVRDLAEPLPAFHTGRVVLLGDAAHAMTPELGQGAGQALEDAVTLAAVIGDAAGTTAELLDALGRYTALRLPRTAWLARRSRSAGRVNQASGPGALTARAWGARILAALPARAAVRGLAGTLDWTPPRRPPAEDGTGQW